jgi:hypothetical protein
MSVQEPGPRKTAQSAPCSLCARTHSITPVRLSISSERTEESSSSRSNLGYRRCISLRALLNQGDMHETPRCPRPDGALSGNRTSTFLRDRRPSHHPERLDDRPRTLDPSSPNHRYLRHSRFRIAPHSGGLAEPRALAVPALRHERRARAECARIAEPGAACGCC